MCVLFILLLTATSALCQDVKVAGQSSSSQDSIKVLVSEGCVAQVDAADGTTGGKELSLSTSAPLVLTHQIRLVPSGSGPGSCGCEGDLSALRARVERLEREVSALREKCGDPENPGCCSSRESKGPGCSISPDSPLCPNDCSDQGRCVDGRCQCFPGFSGVDCAKEECPVDCGQRGRCVDGVCQCDPGFSGPDCSQSSCPGNCNNRGRCVDGKCVCNSGFGGENCANKTCPGNCNNRGRCVDGKCVCESGFGGENCADKTCPGNCNNRGRCVDGKCQCNPGFGGENCADKTCPRKCNNRGRCVDGKCQCNPGFGGENCADKTCPGNCNNRGRCVNGKCQCNPGFSGPDCSRATCPGNCNNRGRCVNGKCVCNSGFGGENCADKTCPGNCNNRGRCVDGKCVCNSGFGGENCADKTCPGNCNNRGHCVDGKCVCNSGFGGENCADKTCPGNCNNRGHCVDGKCVCNSGFGGENCADKSCPGNCNNRGRCVNGKCVCESGFGGLDCGSKTCPDNCSGRGVCVDGKCVCDSGFGGENCADKTCPGNCNNRGHCVDGKCVCDSGFKGVQCVEKACPNECSGRGKCVDGRCVCEGGFTGADCSVKGCPGNCNNRGRCVKGKCVCRKGFTGADCGQCQEGLTGPNCDTVMSAVEELQTKDLTQSSVTVVWTQPLVQYESYLLIFTSQKDGAEVKVEVPGSDSSFTQSGLAPGQSYSVTVTGQTGQSRGAPNTAHFNTLPSGPSNLRVVKTSTSSAVVQWEPSPSDVDRYRLTVSRSDGTGRGQELTFDPGASSAHITQLEAGLRYDITLVAEKGRSQSEPVTTHATPGSANVLAAAVTVAPFTEDTLNLTIKNYNKNVKQPITLRLGKVPKVNITKVIRRIPVAASTGANRNTFQPKIESYKTVESGSNLEINKEINLKEGDTGIGLTTPEPKRTCLNRVKVTHGRLSQKDKSSGCVESETERPAKRSSEAQGSKQEPPQSKDLEIPEDRSLTQPYPLQKLLTDTFNKLNVTTFAIHVSEPSNIDSKAEVVADQIMKGLKPITTIKKTIKYLDNPRITSLLSERSQIKMVSPTSATQISVLTNVETNIKDDNDSKTENLDISKPEDERESPREGSSSTNRRTQHSHTIIRQPRPSLLHLRNKTGHITRDSDASLPSPSKMTSVSTDTPFPVTEKPSLSSDGGTDLNKGDSEGAKPKQAIVTALERPSVPHVRPFQNKTHPNNRFYRRPIRLLSNKTQTVEPQEVGVEGKPTTVPPGETEPNMPKDRLPLVRAHFNRSRLAFPRRPYQYTGPFQNRTRLIFRPQQRGPIRKNWTAESPPNGHQNQNSNSDLQDKVEGGAGAKTEASISENPNLNVDNVPKFVENVKERLDISKMEEDKIGIINTEPQISSNREEPGNEESTIMSQTNKSEQLKGLNTMETDLGKDNIEVFTERIEIKNDEMDKNVKVEENDPKIPQDKLKIVENRSLSNMEADDLSIHLDNEKAAKDMSQNNPDQEQNQNSDTKIQVTKTSDQSVNQDAIVSPKTDQKPAEVDGKQNNSGSVLYRRRFKPGVQPTRRVPLRFQGNIAAQEGVSGSDQPERGYGVVATRAQEDSEPKEGHGIKNVSENEKLDPPKEGGVHTNQRGGPSRTVIRRLRPNIGQPERSIKSMVTTRGQEDPESKGHGNKNVSESEKVDSPKEGGVPTNQRGPNQTVIRRLRPNINQPERSIKNVVPISDQEDPESKEGYGNKNVSENEKPDLPKEGDASTDQRAGPSQTVIRQLQPNTDQPERSIKSVAATRGQEDLDSIEGHEIQNENEKLDSPTEGGASRDQRGPSRTVFQQLRPNINQPERSIKNVPTRGQEDPESKEDYGNKNVSKNEKPDSPKEGDASTDQTGGPSRTVIRQLQPNIDQPERSIKNVVATRGQEDSDSKGHGIQNENEKLDSPKEGGTSTAQRGEPSRTVIRQLRPNLVQPEKTIKSVVPTREQEDPDSIEGHGIKNQNEKLDSPKKRGASTDQRREPSRTVIRRLRPNLLQFRNKTTLFVRRGNASLPLSGKINPTSTDKPKLVAEKPFLGDGKGLEGEKQSLSNNEQENDNALRKTGESEDPREPKSLDEVFPESNYKFTVLGKGSGVLSRLSKLVISTGPEPPSDLVFDHVTEDSVTVSWTKPKSKVSGFKVTYTHKEEGEPFSVSLDQGNSSIDLTRLSPGSTYEVSVLSVLGLDESDSISRTFHTLPDPPTDLRAVNVTDSGALLLWRPALATVEKYTIVYGSGTDSEVRVTVSGNTAEEQLKGLQPSTTYTVTISSELDTRKSKETSTSFTTTASGPDGTGDLRATNVMPRTATLSWKPPSKPVTGYKLIYETEGQKKEVLVAPRVTQLNLTKLFPGAEYSVQLQAQGGGGEVLLTTFTTGSLRFPFPSDCSQEQLNGLRVSGLVDIFPLGRQGAELSVWCDMETDGGGWTVFQRRKDGSVNFFRTWKDYVHGFGDPTGEFWLGLETLHTLTTRGRMTLRVDLRDRQDSVFAQYSTFEVAKKNYRLTVAGYSGTAGDSMSYHNNRIFSTKDRDPASLITRCAMSYRGGWWYKNCHEANLNGLYGITSKHQGIIWTSWKGKEASIPFTEMKMRPTDFLPNKNNYRA